ncbi:MAG: FAD-binding oxidoreductase [Candidatus Adiutrix sp.]
MNELIKKLQNIVGHNNVIWGPLDIELYSCDSSPFSHPPKVIVFPTKTCHVPKIIRLAHEANCPIVPRGAGTSLSGGAVAKEGGIMLVTTRLNKVLELDLLEQTVLLECGVVNLDLQTYLKPYGYMFPPDPASQKVATLGGNIAENAGGIKGVKYGITKHHVLGLEIVLADGTLTHTGLMAQGENIVSPDLTGIFLASEGTFAFITKALLKITPIPENFRTISAIFDDLKKSGQAVSKIIAAGIIPTALEILDNELIKALEDYLHLGFPKDAAAMLLIEVDGLGPELDGQMERIKDICRQTGATAITAANTPEERDKLWLARRSGNGAMGRIRPALIVQDVAVPIDKLSHMLAFVQETALRHNVLITQMAHAGDGNLHPNMLYTPSDTAEYQRALDAGCDIFMAAIEAGGTLTGEHGIGLEKIDFMEAQFTQDELEFMALIKTTLDPNNRLNPGKILPHSGEKPQPTLT